MHCFSLLSCLLDSKRETEIETKRGSEGDKERGFGAAEKIDKTV